MKYRIISDTHFWHQMLIDIWDREVWFENKINKSLMNIPKEDTLIHLWDILIWDDKNKHDKYIKSLQCKKILVKWNHDRKSNSRYYDNWRGFVVDSFILNHLWKEIMFVHIPTQDTEIRALQKENRIVIHWHYHKYWRTDRLMKIKHILYSCEYESMQARKLEYMVSKIV